MLRHFIKGGEGKLLILKVESFMLEVYRFQFLLFNQKWEETLESITTLSTQAEELGTFKIASRSKALQYAKAHFLQLFVQNLEETTSHNCDLTSQREFCVLGSELRPPQEISILYEELVCREGLLHD